MSEYEPSWQGTEVTPAGAIHHTDAVSPYPDDLADRYDYRQPENLRRLAPDAAARLAINSFYGRQPLMTVRELIERLSSESPDALVTIGYGPGPLGTVTGTINGYIILDAHKRER
jgi:hypothetical protein